MLLRVALQGLLLFCCVVALAVTSTAGQAVAASFWEWWRGEVFTTVALWGGVPWAMILQPSSVVAFAFSVVSLVVLTVNLTHVAGSHWHNFVKNKVFDPRQQWQMKLADSVMAAVIGRMFLFGVVNLSTMLFDSVYQLAMTAAPWVLLDASEEGRVPEWGLEASPTVLSWLQASVRNTVFSLSCLTVFLLGVMLWFAVRIGIVFEQRRNFVALGFTACLYMGASAMFYVYGSGLRQRVAPFHLLFQLFLHPIPTLVLGFLSCWPAIWVGKIVAARFRPRSTSRSSRGDSGHFANTAYLTLLHVVNGLAVVICSNLGRQYAEFLFPSDVPIAPQSWQLELVAHVLLGPLCLTFVVWKFVCLSRVLWRKSAAAKCRWSPPTLSTSHTNRQLPRVVRDLQACWFALAQDWHQHTGEARFFRCLMVVLRAVMALRKAGGRKNITSMVPIRMAVANGARRTVDLGGVSLQLRAWTGRSLLHTIPLPQLFWKKEVLAEMSLRPMGSGSQSDGADGKSLVVHVKDTDTEMQNLPAQLRFDLSRRALTRAIRGFEARVLPRWLRLFTAWNMATANPSRRRNAAPAVSLDSMIATFAGVNPQRGGLDSDSDADSADGVSSDDDDGGPSSVSRALERRHRRRAAHAAGSQLQVGSLFTEARFVAEVLADELIGRAPAAANDGGPPVNALGVDRGPFFEVVVVLRYPEAPLLSFITTELAIPVAKYRFGQWSGPVFSSAWHLSIIRSAVTNQERARRALWLSTRVPRLRSEALQLAVHALFDGLERFEAEAAQNQDGRGMSLAVLMQMVDRAEIHLAAIRTAENQDRPPPPPPATTDVADGERSWLGTIVGALAKPVKASSAWAAQHAVYLEALAEVTYRVLDLYMVLDANGFGKECLPETGVEAVPPQATPPPRPAQREGTLSAHRAVHVGIRMAAALLTHRRATRAMTAEEIPPPAIES